MTPYIVYILASNFRYRDLTYLGLVGTSANQYKVYDYYPQLQIQNEMNHYKRINDAFIMFIVRALQRDLNIRLSSFVMDMIKRFGYWFIQFPKFTHFRMEGFLGAPYRLPKYPNDKLVLLDITMQLCTTNKLLKDKHRVGVPYHLEIARGLYACPSH